MKPEIILEPLPEHYVRGEEDYYRDKKYKVRRIDRRDVLFQDMKNGLLYTYVYSEGKYEQPEYMIVADMQDEKWDTYNVATGKWGKAMIRSIMPCWRLYSAYRLDEKTYGLTLEAMQYKVSTEKLEKKHSKKRNAIYQVMKQEKKITKKQYEWMHRNVKHYAVYERGKDGAICTCCLEHIDGRFVNNNTYKCPKCKVELTARTENTLPAQTARTFFIPQIIKDGVMLRIINCVIVFKSGKRLSNWTYTGKPGEYWVENLRCVSDANSEKWYEKRDWCSDEWKLNRTDGWIKQRNSPHVYEKFDSSRIRINKPLVNEKALEKTVMKSPLQFIDIHILDRFLNCHGSGREIIYGYMTLLTKIAHFPQIESFIKLEFRKIAGELMNRNPNTVRQDFATKEKELHKFLKISKEQWRYMLNHKYEFGGLQGISIDDIKVMRKIAETTSDVKVCFWLAMKLSLSDVNTLFDTGELKPQKVLTYLERNKGIPIYLYRDYISLAREFNMNLHDDFVAYPRDLNQAHDNLIAIRDEERNKKKLREVKEEDSDIYKVYKKIRKQYSLMTDDFIVRPAKSAQEIVKEGQTLHHCVGGQHYRNQVKSMKSFILFLRHRETPKIPYYTIEIKPSGEVVQAYAAYDKKPDFEKIEPVLKALTEKVKNWRKASYKKTGESASSVEEPGTMHAV